MSWVSTLRNGVWGYETPGGGFNAYTPEQLQQVKAYAGSQSSGQQAGLMEAAANASGAQSTAQPTQASPWAVGGSPTNPYTPTPQPAPNPYAGNNPLGTPLTAAGSNGVSNPYMQPMTDAITQAANQNLTRNLLPAIGRGAVAAGGYGDARMGLAEGVATGDTQNAITNAIAGLYGNAYNTDRSYDLSRIGQDMGFFTAQRGQDLQSQGQGFNQYLSALNAQLGVGQSLTGIGQQQMQQSLYPLQAYANLLNPLTGLNQTNTQQQPGSGGGLAGALGGGLTVAQLLNLINGS